MGVVREGGRCVRVGVGVSGWWWGSDQSINKRASECDEGTGVVDGVGGKCGCGCGCRCGCRCGGAT